MARALQAALAALALVAAGGPARAATAPQVGVQSFAQLPLPLPYPYDERADAEAQVAAAQARAKTRGKLLLVELGGNWCGDCRLLAATMDLPALKPFVEAHYELVTVDVGRFNRNLQIPARFGFGKRLEGVPALLVVDPHTGALLDQGHVEALADARSMSPQALADWLAQWVR